MAWFQTCMPYPRAGRNMHCSRCVNEIAQAKGRGVLLLASLGFELGKGLKVSRRRADPCILARIPASKSGMALGPPKVSSS